MIRTADRSIPLGCPRGSKILQCLLGDREVKLNGNFMAFREGPLINVDKSQGVWASPEESPK